MTELSYLEIKFVLEPKQGTTTDETRVQYKVRLEGIFSMLLINVYLDLNTLKYVNDTVLIANTVKD